LGVYGGTFDPVHLGHLILAQDAMEQLDLDWVFFVPCAQSPHKAGRRTLATGGDRAAMLRLALAPNPRFWLSTCELERPAPSYSIETARELQDTFAGAELIWLIGDDQLPKLRTWQNFDELRQVVSFASMSRGASASQRLPGGVIRLPKRRRIDISATEIRERVRTGRPFEHLVPRPVAQFIHDQRLYAETPSLPAQRIDQKP
jgi:nicotinate-nucleotide adenylyltransferase